MISMFSGTIVFDGDYNGNKILIRYLAASDVLKLLPFINALSREQTYILFQGEQLSLEEEQKYVDGFIEKTEERKAVKLCVFCNEQLVGVADVYMKDKAEKHIGVLGIVIDRKWRSKGIGKILLEHIIKEAEKHIPDLHIITLGVFGNNTIAKKMYEKAGFIEYGALKEGIQYKGGLVDHIYMYKLVHKVEGP